VSFFYFVHDLPADPATGAADAVVAFSILKAGNPVAKAPEASAKTAEFGSMVGPVPLAGLDPGSYVAQLEVRDKITGKNVVRNEHFKVVAAEGAEP
jgi:hypothetical protein